MNGKVNKCNHFFNYQPTKKKNVLIPGSKHYVGNTGVVGQVFEDVDENKPIITGVNLKCRFHNFYIKSIEKSSRLFKYKGNKQLQHYLFKVVFEYHFSNNLVNI